MAEFVNPYTFVPQVAVPERKVPAGHALMADDHFSGVLDVTVTARTPLLIGGFSREREDGSKETVLPRRKAPEGVVMIPGSGLMGAVRSMHEALVGGCMRVLDTNWVPVHRHPADVSETRDLRLAVVTKADGGTATEVTLCDGWHWVPARLLQGDQSAPVFSGDQLQFVPDTGKTREFPDRAVTGSADRRVVRGRSEAHPDGIEPGSIIRQRGMGPVTAACKVVLVTDTNARDPKRPPHFALGQIGPGSPRCTVPDGIWQEYLRTVEGADDLRPGSRREPEIASGEDDDAPGTVTPQYVDVWWPPREEDGEQKAEPEGGGKPQLVGKRLAAQRCLHVGQPVWVAVSGDKVTEVRLSLLWRYQGSGTVGERAGAAKGCTDPQNLCWSCRIFGSADTEGRGDNDLAVQNSYRGHVRVDDLLVDGVVEPVRWHLAPLASPRPGAGQFYLDNTGRRQVAGKNSRPAATWGSVADNGSPRPLRGRKFYWRTDTCADPDSDRPQRGKYRPHQSGVLASKVEMIPAGTVFKGRIAFDNLGVQDYGSLLVALDPRQLGVAGEDGWDDTVTSVGGGKPFGFGSVTIDVAPAKVQNARERYLGEPSRSGPATPGDAVHAFRDAVQADVRKNWQALAHALQFGFVDDKDVWYPPGCGVRGSEDYDKSFEFFAVTNGLQLSAETRPLQSLPDAAAGNKHQVMTSPTGQQRQDEQPRQAGGLARGRAAVPRAAAARRKRTAR